MYPFGITVTFQRQTTVENRYNNDETSGWVDTVTVKGVAFAPAAPIVLDQQGRDGQELRPVLYGVPVGADVKNRDRCVIGGRVWEVDGAPQVWSHPMSGWNPGSVTALKLVEG